MYAPFFGLSKEPFSIAPDPRFLFMSERHREALAHLLYGLDGGGGFVLLTGEIGAGKTTVCRCFLEQVPPHCVLAYVFNPKLDAIELLQTVCAEFGLAPPVPPGSVKAHVDALNAFLLAAHAQGRQAVLVIDEAQSLDAAVLEQLRLLTNLETAERKLLQIVLVGQPELRGLLARPELEQLAQRVIARYHLGALAAAETPQYIRHRLAVAGPAAAMPFDDAALARIHALSGGVPRRINLLADRALLGAYAQGRTRVDKATVVQAAREVFDTAPAASVRGLLARRWALPVAAAGAVLAVAAALALYAAGPSRPRGETPAAAPARAQGPAASPTPLPASATAPSWAGASGRAAATTAATAAATTAAATAEGAVATDPQALLRAAGSDPERAWRELALRWNVAIGEGPACVAAAQAQLACYRSAGGGLAALRQLARPALLTLQAADGTPRYALLTGLGADDATLAVGPQSFVLSLPALAHVWRGDFATFWHVPPGWHDGAAPGPALRDWIEARLRSAGQPGPAPLHDRVWAFQLAQGLSPDGVPGPMTLMRLNRVAGVAEPRLP